MAYGNSYLLGTSPISYDDNLIEIYIYIQEKDYVGTVDQLGASFDSFKINREFDSLDQYILGMNFEMAIINNSLDFYT